MTGTLLGEDSGDNKTTKEHIEGCLSALRSLIKEHNSRGNVSPIRLNFDEDNDETIIRVVVTGKEIADGDLKKPFKETAKTPLTQRIIEFAGPEFKIPANVKLTVGRRTRKTIFVDSLPLYCGCSGGHENIVVHGRHKCSELAKRYSDKVPKTMDEMMVRLDDFVRSEEAFANTKLPKGEVSEASKKLARPVSRREDRFARGWGTERIDKGTMAETHSAIEMGSLLTDPKHPIREKGHYTNDFFQLRRQLESALESGKLNHLIKDARQRGRGNPKGRDRGKDKFINMIRSLVQRKKEKIHGDERKLDENTDCFPGGIDKGYPG
ncbi:hypothetical protein Tco_0027458 [Tanacetum coccineum]